MVPHIKLCGFTREEDVRNALDLGVDAIGLNLARGPRRIPLERAAALARLVTPPCAVWLLFVDAPEDEILRAVEATRATAIQLAGDEAPEPCQRLQHHVPVVKSFRIAGAADLARAQGFPCDLPLLDAAVPGQHGGSGTVWDWSLLKTGCPRRFALAGGLTPANVLQAITCTRPWLVDAASGIESAPGLKDAAKMADFVRQARS